MDKRYDRNIGIIQQSEMQILASSKVCVVGCGGLGGYSIEYLGRIGVGHIVAVDGDVFDITNLNRQILATENTIGKPKAIVAKERMAEVNPTIHVEAVEEFLEEGNCDKILSDCQIVIDALDNVAARKTLQEAAARAGIPMVHGAIAGWNGQVAVAMPGQDLFSVIYGESLEKGDEVETGNPPFTAAIVAGLQVAEAIKLLLHREGVLNKKLLVLDLYTHEYEIIEI